MSDAAHGSVIGIERLSLPQGCPLEGLPYPDDVERVMRSVGFGVLKSAP